MPQNLTLTMIKPSAVKAGHTGAILARINESGFRIAAMKQLQLTRSQAEKFYEIHKDQPFYTRLVEYMISGPIVAAILEKEHAVEDFRRLIGSTDPQKAEPGTIRRQYGLNVTMNAVHGSDSDTNAVREADFFFSEMERV